MKQTFEPNVVSHATRLDRIDRNQLNLFSHEPEQEHRRKTSSTGSH